MSDLADLEAKARAATQGEWDGDEALNVNVTTASGRRKIASSRYSDFTYAQASANAAYIVAAQPSVVLEIIERIRAAEAKAGEPVAWKTPFYESNSNGTLSPVLVWKDGDRKSVPADWAPLYAAPVDTAALAERVKTLEEAGGSKAATDVLSERLRQIDGEGWTDAHDDEHSNGELAAAAATYITEDIRNWPWDAAWWKPSNYRRNLVKAGALILAEIERIDRARTALGGGNE